MSKKKIQFVIGTAPPKEARVALSVSSFEVKDRVTTYIIDVWQAGQCGQMRRRYKDFESFQKRIIAEVSHYGYIIPPLPQKKWFQKLLG